ncbi:hypothetical protein EVAR_62117_1 [Eumeta japonica]|uniref:Uncharacterized protein n=1 Tax=Eumeta variegata TaxID=151549 RepID=A0A4C1Z7T3_EUMVA|nr:hypothetical protein EVAR_62117_1 [Eumeta japonica]
MQVLNQRNPIFVNIRDVKANYNLDSSIREMPSENFEMMHPVASGDNVVTILRHSSPHRRKYEDLPVLIPCCEGKELPIKPELARSGLSAISIRRAGTDEQLVASSPEHPRDNHPATVEHRNSFRCLQRPDLSRVPRLRSLAPAEIEALFIACADGADVSSRTGSRVFYI